MRFIAYAAFAAIPVVFAGVLALWIVDLSIDVEYHLWSKVSLILQIVFLGNYILITTLFEVTRMVQ